MPTLSDKETLVLDNISKKSSLSQRDLAKTTGFSLGLVNVILKRFVKTGFIKISHLNKRKMDYTLTPEGILQVSEKNHRHATNTIRRYKLIQSNLANLLKKLHTSGYDYFSIHGDGELRELVESTLRTCLEEAPVTLGTEHRKDPRAVVLNVTPDSFPRDFQGEVVSVLEKLEF